MSFTSASPAPDRSRWSDVYLAAGARGISSCGDFLAATALALAMQSAGAGGLAVSGLLLAASLPLVVLAPITGRLADRVDSRTLLVAAGVGQAAMCAALAYVDHPALIIGLVGLLACGLAVTQPTLAALLPGMVRRDDLAKASAINQTAGTVGILVGPALAGLLVGQFDVRLPLLVNAVSYLAIVAAGLFLRTRRGGRTARPVRSGPHADGLAPSWRLRRDALILAMALAVAGVVAGVGAINVVELFFLRETLGASTTTYGVVTGAWTAGVIVGGWLLAGTARRTATDATLVRATLVLLAGDCVIVLVAAGVPTAGWLVPLWLVGGALNGGLNVFNNVVVARRVPPDARGRAFAAMGAAVQGAGMLGYLLGGTLLAYVAPRPLVAFCGLAGLVAVAAVVVPVRRAAHRERVAMEEVSQVTPDAATAASRSADAEYATSPVAAATVSGTAGYGRDHE